MNIQHQLRHYWLGWIAMLAIASVLSPINIHIVIAQDLPEIVIVSADLGQPPTPPEAAATPQAPAAPVAPASVPTATLAESSGAPIVEPAPALVPLQTPDVPVIPSEVSTED